MTQGQGPNVQITVTYKGSFFSRLLSGRFQQAKLNAIRQMMEESEARIAEQLRPRSAGVYLTMAQAGKGKASTGHYRRSIHGELSKDRARIHDSNVVYGPWLEGTSSRNQTTRFKGYSVFRRTRDWISQRANGILERHIRRALRP